MTTSATAPPRAVLDCNVVFQALVGAGAARACWDLARAGGVELCVSPPLIEEIRRLPHRRSARRFPRMNEETVETFIADLLAIARAFPAVPERFTFARDPDDAHYLNLAIVADATLIASNDRDLLDLMFEDNPDGQRLRSIHPTLRILTPRDFLRQLAPPKDEPL